MVRGSIRGAKEAPPLPLRTAARGSRKKYTRENNLASRVRAERKMEEARQEEEEEEDTAR